MSKYLNVFNTLEEYQAFSASTEYVQPNVALVKETNVLYYDYGNNQPQADQSDFKLETEETSVGGNKFGNSAITKVNYIPTGITSLNSAFNGYSSIVTAPEIPESVKNMYNTFYGCSSLVTAPEIPNSVKNLNHTFYGCSSLVTAPEIPNSVEDMYATFLGCTNLVNAPSVIPSGVTTIGYIFSGCTSLVTAPVIASGVASSMTFAFDSCTSLVTVPQIPSNIGTVGCAFEYCSNLKEVTFLHTTPPYYYKVFFECPKLETIYVPDEAVDAFKTATGWLEHADKFKPLSSKPTE